MALFRRNQPLPEPEPQPESQMDVTASREKLFAALSDRIGPEYAAIVREDFEGHIASDPVHGVEAAYYCLVSKMFDYVDALNVISLAGTAAATPPSSDMDGPDDFTVFRKIA